MTGISGRIHRNTHPRYVTTVRQLIYWEYAKLIARAAGFEENYGFIVSRYKKLVSGEMNWSSSIRDYEKELDKGRICTYCGASGEICTDHIIPKSRAGVDPRLIQLQGFALWVQRGFTNNHSDLWLNPDRAVLPSTLFVEQNSDDLCLGDL